MIGLFLATIISLIAMWACHYIGRKKQERKWFVLEVIAGSTGVALAVAAVIVSCLSLFH